MTSARGWAGRLAGGVAVVVAAAAPVVAYVGNLGFAPLMALAGAASLPAAAGARGGRSAPLSVLLGVAVLAAASYGWGVVRPADFPRYGAVEALTALKLLLQLALYGAFVTAAAALSPAQERRAVLVLAVGFTIMCALLLAEALGGATLYQWIKREAHQATRPDLARRNVARAAYAAVLVLWPAVLALRARRWGWVAAVLGGELLAAAVLLQVDAPVAALAASGGAFLLVLRAGPGAARAIGAGAAALTAFAPVLALWLTRLPGAGGHVGGLAKASWAARVAVWRFTAERIAERPLTGWGLDASRAFPGNIPLHTHDLALQVWLELGAAGAALAAAFWWLVFEGCARLRARDPALGATATGAATAYLVVGALSFGAWQEWWLALGALAAASVAWAAGWRTASPPAAPGLYPAPS